MKTKRIISYLYQHQGIRFMIFLDIVIDYERRVVMKKNQPVELTKTEFDLLYYLLQQEGRVIGRDQLMKILRPFKDDSSSRAIDVTILRLRKKLGTGPRHQEYITTIRGVGYKISWPVITLQQAGMQIY